MKCGLKSIILQFLLTLISCQLFACATDTISHNNQQATNSYRTWSIGVNGGILTPYTLLANKQKQDFTSPDMQSGYGFYVKDQISHSFGLLADFMAGKLQGDHSAQLNSSNVFIYSRFDTKINWSASLSGNIILAHINSKNHKGLIQPYLTLGGGMLSYQPELHSYYRNAVLPAFRASSGFYIPAGLGLKFDLSKGVNLDLGYQVNFFSSDDLDGNVYGSNNDKFSYTHIGLEFALGNSKKRQMASVSYATAMREERMAHEKRSKDSADMQQALLDAENARQARLKRSLDSINAIHIRLTMDSDGDGVPDVKDKCPNTPAGTKVDSVGCPLPVIMSKPEMAKVPVTDEDKIIVGAVIKNLKFYPNTDVISQISFPGLNRVVKLLVNKNLSIKLDSYMDNIGSADANLKLSLARAEAVKKYMVNRGVAPSHIITAGYGSAHPIASNKTAAGRKRNCRIEFKLF